jgi:hypothetical protein
VSSIEKSDALSARSAALVAEYESIAACRTGLVESTAYE